MIYGDIIIQNFPATFISKVIGEDFPNAGIPQRGRKINQSKLPQRNSGGFFIYIYERE
jgi:hypothetical protein